MKKKIVFSTIIALGIFTQSAFAELPAVQFSESERVVVKWENVSDIGTLELGEVQFSVDFEPMSKGTYTYEVTYKIDDNKPVTVYEKISPGETVKKYNVSATAGVHNITVTVSRGGSILYEKSEEIYVMKAYKKQFMDELSGRGINTHYEWSPYKDNYELTTDLVELSGLNAIRNGDSWEYYEKQKNVYDTSLREPWLKLVNERGIEIYNGLYYGNGKLYLPERGMTEKSNYDRLTGKPHPQTQESIQALSDATLERVKYLKEKGINTPAMETWNEPNARGDVPERMAQIFNDFVRPIKIKYLKNGFYDMDISSLTPHTNYITGFTNTSMQMGLYPYFDKYSAHEYDYEGGFEVTNLFDVRMKKVDDFVTEYGGWKKIDLTETGFPIVPGFATLQTAAEEMAKNYIICEYNNFDYVFMYDLMNDGTNETYTEHNFGSVYYDGKPKPQYIALTNFNNQTSGGVMIGEIETGLEEGTRAFVYYKDGKPVVVAWSCTADGNDVTWNLPGESVEIIDNYGNTVASETDSVVIGRECVYIRGISDKWIQKAVYSDIKKLNAEWLERYSGMLSDDVSEKVKSVFENAETVLADNADEAKAFEIYKSYMDLGLLIIEDGRNGILSEVEVSKRLYRLYRSAEVLNNFYITLYSGDVPKKIENRYSEVAQRAMDDYINELNIKQYSDALLHFVRDYNNDLEMILKMEDNPSKAGVIKAWDTMATDLLEWYDALSSYETETFLGIQIQTPYYDRISYVNSEVTTEVNITNYTDKVFEGTVCVFDEEGNKVAETGAVKLSPDGGYVQTSVTVHTERPKDGSKIGYYNYCFVDENGNILTTQRSAYEVHDRFAVETLPSDTTAENMTSIKINVRNLADTTQKAHFKLISDGNFDFENENIDVFLAPNEEKIVEFPVVNVKNTEFHIYSFKYEVQDDEGNVVASKDAMLSFTNIVKTDKEISVQDFDGDISDWEDAYPIYINTPENSDKKESWQNAECSARGFLKYDNDNVYVLVDIYDEAYLQPFTAGNMWQGDSVQIALDPENNGGNAYQADDFEIGFSVTPLGNEIYTWKAPIAIENGLSDTFKLVRNDDLGFSRYLIKLNKEMISNVNIKDGATLALNVAINDNDYLQRENYYQFTPGTADKKAPEFYKDFIFVANDDKNLIDCADIFPITAGDSQTVVSSMAFSDISGHWARDIITSMSAQKKVYGMGDGTFMPDKTMTRAEFLSVISNCAEFNTTDVVYSDIEEGTWYEPAVRKLGNIIPEEMTENKMLSPDKEITREEAIYILSAVYLNGEDTGDVKKDCREYPDGEEVSDWAEKMMNFALDRKLIVGSSDGKLYPKSSLTRAEATVMVYNLFVND